MNRDYQICTRCIMDTTDPDITFDENGLCNHCRRYDKKVKDLFYAANNGEKLNTLVHEIKTAGADITYDCIIGLSGGVDSTYVAYLVKKLGLRPLAIHFDNGWNDELAVSNIDNATNKLNIDLYTYVVDWDKFKDLQLSLLKASVPDAEIPTDHGILALLYREAVSRKIRYIITGSNLVTEGIHPTKWGYGLWDWKYIKDVHSKFGKVKLKSYIHCNMLELWYFSFVKRIKRVPLLNYIPYVKSEAIETIEKDLGWSDYGGKHCESIYTRFLQSYILPRKFNIDKRRAHLSTLICSGQISRDDALEEMNKEPYSDLEMMAEDRTYVLKKLELNEEEFDRLMSLFPKTVQDYSSNYWLFPIARSLSSKLEVLKFV